MKIEEQVLSREQMAHLKELGVDTSDASMMWVWILDKESEGWAIYINNSIMKSIASMSDDGAKRFIPTYTIGDLIEKLPRYIDERRETYLSITNIESLGEWRVCYMAEWGSETDWFMSPNVLTALYDCLCWVAENHKELIR